MFKTVLGKNLTTNYRTTEILNNKISERKVIFWVVWPNLLENANGTRVLRRPTAAARTDIPETAARRQTVVSGKLRRHSAAGPVLPAARLLLSRERARARRRFPPPQCTTAGSVAAAFTATVAAAVAVACCTDWWWLRRIFSDKMCNRNGTRRRATLVSFLIPS